MGSPERRHGTRAKYVLEKCRCFSCKVANSNYRTGMAARRRARAPWIVRYARPTGEWWCLNQLTGERERDLGSQQAAHETREALNALHALECDREEEAPPLWADEALVRQVVRHIRNLQAAGIGLRQLAALGVCGRTRLMELVNGASYNRERPAKRWLKHATAQRILDVEPSLTPAASGACVPAGEVPRLLGELLAACGSRAETARRLGYLTPALQTMGGDRVRQSNLDRVRAVHDRIWRGYPRADPAVGRLRSVCRCPEWRTG